ncbi:Receptor-like serine/threonine-protein kinase NCRK [Senna tora]|uniref:non-specific serine/threonine protein kinase n=1 Tax=Senna tora TaxID=362788 RepID=A0A834TT00_9FABA|nr:Receptor-like serine/threonine-protein kinase NCRK [Senna tora]
MSCSNKMFLMRLISRLRLQNDRVTSVGFVGWGLYSNTDLKFRLRNAWNSADSGLVGVSRMLIDHQRYSYIYIYNLQFSTFDEWFNCDKLVILNTNTCILEVDSDVTSLYSYFQIPIVYGLKKMKLLLKVVLAFVISLLWIQLSFCDGPSGTSSLNKWTCTCSFQGNQSSYLANCSTSCDCHSELKFKHRLSNMIVVIQQYAHNAEENASMWTCLCDPNGFPNVGADNHSPNCFSACNCTWGARTTSQGSKNHISSKIVIIILLICIICTTVAFLASIICYVWRRDRCPIQPPIFSPDKETSFNSTTDLISQRTSSVPETKAVIYYPVNNITGCFPKATFLFGSKRETFRGNVFQFSFAELEYATENFSTSNLIGLGGSSYVYRGQLKNGINVAVKRLKTQGGPEAESIFLTEVVPSLAMTVFFGASYVIELLSRLHHCHLVPLIGYCSEIKGKHAEKLLVFEYMINGNLRDRLDLVSGKNMDWPTRVTIAIGAARGLEYLHEAAAPRILHRDVKSTNILLDENYQAKITDLGMAKNLRADDLPSGSNSPARMQGTFGYFAPEYAIVGRASLKSDVFSFGVVLLEIISGRQPIYKSAGKEESLVIWAAPRLQDSQRVINELVDPQLKGKFPEEEVQIMAYLAKECLLLDPDTRPTMSEVVQILSTISPDKSRRTRNVPMIFLQEPKNAEKRRQAPSKTRADTVSAENMESLILVTSKAESWQGSEDEMVDLTEPRVGHGSTSSSSSFGTTALSGSPRQRILGFMPMVSVLLWSV